MDIVKSLSGLNAASLAPIAGTMLRFIPEPKTRGLSFKNVLSGAAGLLSDVAPPGLDMSQDIMGLLQEQVAIQLQMQTVSMISNISKSEHETRMAAVRNMRVD